MGQIGHRGIQVGCPDCVSDRFALLVDRSVLLSVGRRHDAFPIGDVGFPSDIEKLLGHFQIKLVPRHFG